MMNWDIVINIIKLPITTAIITLIIGSIATLGIYIYIQKRRIKIHTAVSQREKIYEPLFNETVKKLKSLNEFSNPFDARASLEYWINLQSSDEIRIPNELKILYKKFHSTAKEFDGIYLKANNILQSIMYKKIDEIRNELDEHEYSDGNIDILKRNIFDGYKGDFFAGKILEKIHNYNPNSILKTKKDSPLTFYSFFKDVCNQINEVESIDKLRKEILNMIKITEDLKKFLEAKIKYILRKYENKSLKI